ncbi:serine/threonine-protein kinase [Flammeovirga sp. SubArs3]|uniref:serine/threonine protein kinase n=1 Tax=Flammeovirga sp. SubArs3 TaxID=2995316 RepID=UPI00248C5938|nr:serine/threonine-protein kinase [Flammeovirga sp. SubArs3]
MIDNIIFNYRLTKKIGTGGMATVYLGIHEKLGTPAAVKVLHKNFVENEKVKQRFINEAKALYSLSHPYIVRLLNYEDDGEHLIMILEYIDGVDLKEYIQQHPEIKSVDNAIPFFSKVLEAFAYAHNKGLVHRDIKPSNIMVNKEGNPVVLDFGIAKLQDNMEASLTGTNALMGSRPYMSPEQIKSAKHLDHRSDIYSLGVTLYQLLTGENAYDTTTLSEWDVMNKIVTEPLPRASEKNIDVTEGIEKVIDKATAKKAEDRFQNCDEFALALVNHKSFESENIVDESTLVEEENSKPYDMDSTLVEEDISQKTQKFEENSSTVVPKTKENRDNKLPFIAAGITGILLLSGIVFYSFMGSDTSIKEEPSLVSEVEVEKVEESDDNEWLKAENLNTSSSYSTFIEKFPESEHKKNALENLARIHFDSLLGLKNKHEQVASFFKTELSKHLSDSIRSNYEKLKKKEFPPIGITIKSGKTFLYKNVPEVIKVSHTGNNNYKVNASSNSKVTKREGRKDEYSIIAKDNNKVNIKINGSGKSANKYFKVVNTPQPTIEYKFEDLQILVKPISNKNFKINYPNEANYRVVDWSIDIIGENDEIIYTHKIKGGKQQVDLRRWKDKAIEYQVNINTVVRKNSLGTTEKVTIKGDNKITLYN